jgi:hypothetical protein
LVPVGEQAFECRNGEIRRAHEDELHR